MNLQEFYAFRKKNTLQMKQHAKVRAVNLVCVFLLIGIGFVYLYPIIYMCVMSVMPTEDLVNPTIQWIPTALDFESFSLVSGLLEYPKTLASTFFLATVCAALSTAVCCLVGYALARYPVPLKKVWTLILLLVFILPVDVLAVPRYVLFTQFHLVGTIWSVLLPAMFGQGLKSSLCILLFMQSFGSYPKSYDEAAELDGAGKGQIFLRVAIPMAIPVIVLTFLLSFIWYWNETAQTGMYLSGSLQTLPLKLEQFDALYNTAMSVGSGSSANRLNERIQMTATIMAIAPLILLYFGFQKSLISSIESSGVTGE